ncbi:unnamed protein product [Diamesa hyperborea]
MQRGGRGGRGRGNNRFNNNFHANHDDRDRREWKPEIKRRVSFKTSVRNNNNQNSVNDVKVRAMLEDEDMAGEMSQSSDLNQRLSGGFQRNTGRGSGSSRGRRKGSPIPRNLVHRRKLIAGPSGWFQVTIQHGHKYEKDVIINSLINALAPNTFQAFYYKMDPENRLVTFYLDDFKMAEMIMNLDRTIQLPDGFKMMIRVRSSIPQVAATSALKERMKLAMVKRYNLATKALDLTKFHADVDLTDVFCALFRPTIMLVAIDIISENIPELEALNLNDNKIHLLDHFKNLKIKLPCLKILYLGQNRINMISALDSLKGLPLIELMLEGNPCKDRIKDQLQFVSDVRKKFPKLMKLDGEILAKSIGFDIDDDEEATKHLPQVKTAFLCNQGGAEIVQKFLVQYFELYDSDNRQQLLDAYHEHAMLSITATYDQHINQDQRLNIYQAVGRNLLRTRDFEGRFKTLKRGRLQAVSFLSELPLTKHDLQSFAVDLTLFTPQMILLTVTGLFKERRPDKNAEYVRSFQRSLVIVPNNNGFCIRNELLHINNASVLQEKCFMNPAQLQVNQMPVQPNMLPTNSMAVAPVVPGVPNDVIKMQMVQAMSQHSNMNIDWSRKCLEETNWDFNKAGLIFTELHQQNKIPPEAFVK